MQAMQARPDDVRASEIRYETDMDTDTVRCETGVKKSPKESKAEGFGFFALHGANSPLFSHIIAVAAPG
jgi:hypothetical protein